jgi:hypothetical protein
MSLEKSDKYKRFERNNAPIRKSIDDYTKWLQYDKEHPVNKSKRLLIVPEFNYRESLLGYLLRVSEANFYDANSTIIAGGKITTSEDWTTDCDKIATGRFNIPNLAKLLGIATAEVYNMTYTVMKATTTKSPGTIVMDSFEYPLELMRIRRPRVCIECLKEDNLAPSKYPYHRRIWDIAHYTVCTKHYVLLQDLCPSCKKQLSWARSKLTRCQCGYDFFQIKPVYLPLEHTLLSARVALSLHSDEIEPDIDQIDALESGYFMELVKNVMPDDPDPIEYSETPTEIADEIYARELEQRGYKRKPTRFSFNEMPNEMLHRHFVSLYPELFRSSLPNYSAENHLVQYKAQAANIIGISITSFDKFMEVFPPTDGETYTKADLLYLAELYKKLLTNDKTSQILGISQYSLKTLIDAEIIKPIFGPNINGYGDYLFHEEAVLKLMDDINNKVIAPNGNEKLVGLGEYADISVKHRKPYAELVKEVLLGTLPIYDFNKPNGLSSITVNHADLVTLNTVDDVGDDLMTIEQVANHLSIYTDAVYRTVKTGLLPVTKSKVNKALISHVSKDDLARFMEKYVFVNEIAINYQCNSTNLADKIMDEGISPISGPGIDNNLLFIFKRSDIERLDIKMVIHKSGYQSRVGRPRKGSSKWDSHPALIDAASVATRLSTSVQKVSRLVRDGLLEPYDHKGTLGNKRFFEVSTFEAYLNKFKDNPALVTFDDAQRITGETELQFRSNWIKSKRISLILDGLNGRYISRKRLDEILAFKKYAISTRDAAELLGVHRSVIQNKHKLGSLKPISGPGIDEFTNYFYEKQQVREIFPDTMAL